MPEISVIINSLNEESDIGKAIKSVNWAHEIIVCDMYSEDKTVEIAKKLGAKVFFHKRLKFVEPARNFAISRASSDWILILDPDEEISESLKEKLIEISSSMNQVDYVKIPRKNLIFGTWMKASMWWPDLNIRFFRKGKVNWGNKIHIPPEVSGVGLDLETDEKWAIVHHHYKSISQFIERMDRYTNIQAKELFEGGYKFDWQDLIKKPLSEFLSRFFASRGFDDGLHGLALSLLQSFSFIIVYLKIWEMEKFNQKAINLSQLRKLSSQSGKEIDYWFKNANLSNNSFKRFFQKVKNNL